MKVGDYIKVLPGVHDDRMPDGRRDGLVIEILGEMKDQVNVMFHNSEILKFHISQVQTVIL